MNEKELTRLEMATLLFVNDRHHSQLTDLMPEKSGMTGHGKDLFEPTLKDVADYKAPTFEPGGGLQQGTYVPKGKSFIVVLLIREGIFDMVWAAKAYNRLVLKSTYLHKSLP